MAKRKRKKKNNTAKKRTALGVALVLLALVMLTSLVTHQRIDDSRITGEIDAHLNPFGIHYSNEAGMFGAYLAWFLLIIMGWLAYFVPAGTLLVSIRMLVRRNAEKLQLNTALLFSIGLLGTMIYNVHLLAARTIAIEKEAAGGLMAEKLTALALTLVGTTGSYILLAGVILILLIMYTSVTPLLSTHIPIPGFGLFRSGYQKLSSSVGAVVSFEWLAALFTRSNDEYEDEEYDEADDESDDLEQFDRPPEKRIDDPPAELFDRSSLDASGRERSPHKRSTRIVKKSESPERLHLESLDYAYPSLELLAENKDPGPPVTPEELSMTARMLKETLETFGVKIEGEIEKYPGPVITRYEFKPGVGIKVNQVVNLSDDLALALKAKRIRIVAPIPGKAAVGVEIPNRQAQLVCLRDILSAKEFTDPKIKLPLALGKTISGKPFVADLAKLPHLLIAGATGSGKSVCMNVIVSSLLYRLHPHQVRFIMIDPKMLELSVYKGIPHLGRPVVTNPRRAEKVLSDSVVEMESRYRKLAEAGVRNIEDFNSKQTKDEDKLAYIVILVDELADLMMSSTSSKTELLITRLAQMARAVGIHLVLATQRPSVDVITGLIKANFPARIAFQVSSKVDSRTIIDGNGAEKLLGAGDMLFLHASQPESIRIHGAYISSDETDRAVGFIRDQGLPMFALDNISQAVGETTETEIDFGDPLFKEACEVVVRHKQGSVSLLQRRLGIGYQRAARLIDKLEQAGIVSTFDGSKAREVLVDSAHLQTLFANAPATASSGQN